MSALPTRPARLLTAATAAAAALALALPALLATGCGRAPESWVEVLRAARGGAVVVEAPTEDLAALARRAAAGWSHGARVVALGSDAPEAGRWLERLGAERAADGGWVLGGLTFGGAGDVLLASFADPDAPGAPLVLLVGDEPTLAAHLAALDPPPRRPSARVVRRGATVWRAPLRMGGGVVAKRAEVVLPPSGFRLHEAGGELAAARVLAPLEVFRGTRVAPERADAYLADVAEALGRAARWCGGVTGGARLELHARGVTFAAAGGRDELGVVDPAGHRVAALLTATLPDDGGAAAAEALARRTLGPPASTETARAFGVAAAGRYWGRPLEQWPSEGELGPLARTADLARRLRALAESGDADGLRAAWSGASPQLDPAPADGVAVPRTTAFDGELRGVVVDLPPAPLLDREDLTRDAARAASLGANGVSVSCAVLENAPLPERVGDPRPAVGRTAQGDALLAAFLDEARVVGLGRLTLRPRVLEWDSGYDVARRKTTTVAGWDEVFASYVAAFDHVATLADLLGVEQLVVGEGLHDATRTEESDGTGLPADVLAAKRAGWDRLVERVRLRFGGRVLYVADWPGEAGRLAFWDRFDALAVSWYPSMRATEDRPLSRNELRGVLSSRLDAMAELAAERGMPWQVARFGVPAARDAARDGRDPGGPPDDAEQARVYAAFAHALDATARRSAGFQGVSLSGWSGAADAGARSDRVVDRAAESALRRVFGEGRETE